MIFRAPITEAIPAKLEETNAANHFVASAALVEEHVEQTAWALMSALKNPVLLLSDCDVFLRPIVQQRIPPAV